MTNTIIKTGRTFSVSERLERLPVTSYQQMLFLIIATAFLFDGVEIVNMTFALPSIKAEFHLTLEQAGLLASITFLGMFIGASSAGILADRFGRRNVFQWSMVIWGFASLVCGMAPNLTVFALSRIVLGVGMAMEPIAGQALLSELLPAKQRGKYLSYFEGFAILGTIVSGIFAYFFLPLGGWRLLFIAEAVPAAFVFVVRRGVPESPRWLEKTGRLAQAESTMNMIENRVSGALGGAALPEPKKLEINETEHSKFALPDLFGPMFLKRTCMLWCLWFFALLGFFGFTTWLGELLMRKGYAITKSSLYLSFIWCGGIAGFLATGKMLETIGRKPTLVIALIGSTISLGLYANASDFTQLVILGLIMQFFIFSTWCTIYAYTPELYPTDGRATGVGFASAVGRIGALVAPFTGAIALSSFGQNGAYYLSAGAFFIAAVTTWALGEETKGRILEEISQQ
ncbi:MAG: MFS transporter [Candidatus Melainabacteria bacterium]|nr:MAG: MFS transporter [Candidatus Melainabacteria bacterium]